jgi:N-acetylmuramoyl-L-alanine amidase
MSQLVVLIDNGHGNNTAGKCSPDKSIREYLYTREIAAAVYQRLLDIPNIKPVLITPELQDTPLSVRVNRINKYCTQYGSSNCILFSIHLNASGNGEWMAARGWSVWTTRGQNNSDKLATLMYKVAVQLFGHGSCRKDMVDGDPDYESNFYIIKGANCPAILTENFFQDNKFDVEYLLSTEGFNNIVALHAETAKLWANPMT